MASAASRASGLPATTFNAAGLNARTVPHPVASNIDAIYVKGEPLHGLNKLPVSPDAAATRSAWVYLQEDQPGLIRSALTGRSARDDTDR
jgi:hypothetical protein